MLWNDVSCVSRSYLSIAQCSYSTYIDSGCTNSNSYDATVYCCKTVSKMYKYIIMLQFIDSTRIWDSSPFPGMIRLQGGDYSNEGHVEVYCHGQWGTICSTGFDYTDANTICKQLGYDSYDSYNHLLMLVALLMQYYFYEIISRSNYTMSHPIWSSNMYSTSSDRCYGTRNTCPSTSVTSCSHTNDVTLTCS